MASFSKDQVTTKLVDALGLDEDFDVDILVQTQLEMKEDDDVWSLSDARDCDRFARAMRLIQRDPASNVSPNGLTQALLRFHLEHEGVDTSRFPSEAATAASARGYLENLIKARVINEKQADRALFYFITEKCIQEVQGLIVKHKSPLEALHAGLPSHVIARHKADLAMFCLLTDLSPTEARLEYNVAPSIELTGDALTEASEKVLPLPDAVKKALTKRTDLLPRQRAVRYLQAELFPFECSPEAIEKCLIQHDDGQDEEFSAGRAQFKCDFFTQKTNCGTREEAQSILAEHGSMEIAVKAFRKKVLAGPALPNAFAIDTPGVPDATSDTIIVGLIGTVDHDDPHFTASPTHDGWFISDALFQKHCLKGMGSEQTWLTCLDFGSLLRKYGGRDSWAPRQPDGEQGAQLSWATGYVHGKATEERVVVLDQDNLKDVNKNVLRCNEKDLKTRYLATLEEKFAHAEDTGRPVLLLMFAHGDIDSPGNLGGLVIGFRDPWGRDKEEFLRAEDIEAIHRKYPKVQLSLFMTSCFSGHWVTTPYFKSESITVLAGARPDEESHAWRQSASWRHGGGVFTGVLLEELKQEPTSATEQHKAREYQELVDDLAADCSRLCSPTLVEVSKWSLPMFSEFATQEKFYKRTGYALYEYEKNYNKLKKVPATSEVRLKSNPGGIARTGRFVPLSSRMSSYGQTTSKLRPSVSYLAFEYQTANKNKMTSDHEIESLITQFHAGIISELGLRILQAQLTYRMGQLSHADRLVKQLELYLGAAINIHDWDEQTVAPGDRDSVGAIATQLRQNTNWFKPTKEHDGQVYAKPYKYLAYAMHLHGIRGVDAVNQLIARGQHIINETVKIGSKRVRKDLSWKDMMEAHRKKPRMALSDFVGFVEGQENAGTSPTKSTPLDEVDPYAGETEEETRERLDFPMGED